MLSPSRFSRCCIRSFRPLISCRSITNAVIRDDDPQSKAIWDAAKPFNSMPGPKSYPIVGFIPDLMKHDDQKDFIMEKRYFMTIYERFGPMVRLSNPSYLYGTAVHTNDPEIFKLMLRNDTSNPSRSSIMEESMSFVHKKANIPMFMFFTSGEEWKKLRTAAAKPMLPRKVAMLASPLYDAANRLGDHWLERKDENGMIDDIRGDLQKWALNGVGWFIFNTDIDVFNPNNEISKEFSIASTIFIDAFVKLITSTRFYTIYPTKNYKDYVRALSKMHAIGENIMKNRFEELENLVSKGEDYLDENRISVIEYMLIDGRITKEEALSQACDLLAAGVDTTSSTGAFLLHHIAQHPDIQNDLFNEINHICGDKEFPDFNDLQNMSLVRNCVKEILRMYQVALLVLRNLENNLVLHGYQVPKGTTLAYNPMMAAKSFYGADYYKFDPYRWYYKNKEEQDILKFISVPFGFGVRMCYGRRLAELELHLLLVNMIKRFTLSSDQPLIRAMQKSVVRPKDAIRLQIKPR